MRKLSASCLISVLCFGLLPSWSADDYKCEIEIDINENVLMSKDKEKAILDKGESTSYKFKATSKFTTDSEGEWQEYKEGKERKYRWEPQSMMQGKTVENGQASIGTCTPGKDDWGTEFKVKAKVRMELHGGKTKYEIVEDEMDVIAPLIKIKSAKFSKNNGGNGFVIHDKLRGTQVPSPEFKKDDKTDEKEKSPIGYYAGDIPFFIVTFEALPESMKTITVKCDQGIFESEETELSINGGKAEGPISSKKALERKCKGGEEIAVWSFSVLGAKLSNLKEKMNVSNCYVLLDEGSQDTPWKSLLRVAFNKWGFNGATSHDELMDRLSKGISNSASYNDGWNPETGQTGSSYVHQNQSPMPLSVARMVDDIDGATAKIICVEAAGLMEYSSAVLGAGGVSGRGFNWIEFKTMTNAAGEPEERTWRSGHAYCLYGGTVHDPVPSRGGSTSMTEQQFIENYKTKFENRRDFSDPRGFSFSFQQ